MTVREIYRLRHQKAVGFNRARSRVIEQLVAQRGECTDTAIFAALRDELARITADEAQMNAEMNTLLRASLADMGIDTQIAEGVFLHRRRAFMIVVRVSGGLYQKVLILRKRSKHNRMF